jgi:pyridoxine kinase
MSGNTVAAISSLVMRGAVGLRAIQFALERRGSTVWSVPTVVMPWHPGHGPSTRTAMGDLPRQLAELAGLARSVDAVITGYFASAEQVGAAATFIAAVRAARPEAPILVDPVTGDERGRYVPDEVADAIRDDLVPLADVATPNVNELRDFVGDGPVVAAARRLGAPTVVVTSVVEGGETIGAMAVTPDEAVVAEHRRVEPAPRGTGDLFGAVFLSARLAGADERAALEEASAATLGVVEASPADTLALCAAQEVIAAPPLGTVTMRPA